MVVSQYFKRQKYFLYKGLPEAAATGYPEKLMNCCYSVIRLYVKKVDNIP
jgi:hypothetical protein